MRLLLDPLRDQFFPRGLPDGSRHYWPGPILDQGNTGTCVGHAWFSKIQGAPIKQPPPMSAFDLYRRFVLQDEWSDNDGDSTATDAGLQAGTSVRAGAKVCQSIGLLTNYVWAADADDVRAWHLANFGGVVFGVNWTTAMFRPDSQGFVSYTGPVEGGHSFASTGWNDRVRHNGRYVRAVRCQNSWGQSWGQLGRFWIEMDDLAKLIADDGEACAAVEQKVVRP